MYGILGDGCPLVYINNFILNMHFKGPSDQEFKRPPQAKITA
jgi:hypothetical protein